MSVTRPLILLTNDDGIHSSGLLAVAEAVCDLGELLIAAPATQQTGMGRGSPPVIDGTVDEVALTVRGHTVIGYGISGSPAQAVLYGVLAIAERQPALVISGINYGENVGTCVTISGTVGAALQAAELGIPGLAISLETDRSYHYESRGEHRVEWGAATHATRRFAEVMLGHPMPFDVDVLKIDVPDDATPQTPWRLTRQSRQAYYEIYRTDAQPAAGMQVGLDYRIHVDWETLEPDSDIYALARDRVIAVTPLSQDLTSRADLGELERMLRGDEKRKT